MIKLSNFIHRTYYLVFFSNGKNARTCCVAEKPHRNCPHRFDAVQVIKAFDIDSIYNSNYTEMHFKCTDCMKAKAKRENPLRLTNPYVLCSISSNRLQHCVFRNCIKHEESKALAPAAVARTLFPIFCTGNSICMRLDRGQINPN